LAYFKKPEPASSRTPRAELVIVNPLAHGNSPEPGFCRDLKPPVKKAGDYYVAQYDYSARTQEDLSFNAGDTLEALDKSHGDWWFAKALTGVSASRQGYIPANYVAPVESIDAEP